MSSFHPVVSNRMYSAITCFISRGFYPVHDDLLEQREHPHRVQVD